MAENPGIEEEKFEKWNEFPQEIKRECIKKLDFKTRWNLRCTSKTEKSLVDSQKMKIEKAYFCPFTLQIGVRLNSVPFKKRFQWSTMQDYGNSHPEYENLMEYILHHGIFKHLIISMDYEDIIPKWHKKLLQKNEDRPIFVDNLDLHYLEKPNGWKIGNEMESVVIEWFDNTFEEVTSFKAKVMVLLQCTSRDIPHKFAQNWIQNDAEIGKKLYVMCRVRSGPVQEDTEKSAFQMFCEQFEDRIVSERESIVRIKTDNKTKHILLEEKPMTTDYGNNKCLKMTVIPAETKQYDNAGWLETLEQRVVHYKYLILN